MRVANPVGEGRADVFPGCVQDGRAIETRSMVNFCEICWWVAFVHLHFRLLHDAGIALLVTHCQSGMVTARRSAGLSLKKSGRTWMGEASPATAPMLRRTGNCEFSDVPRCGLQETKLHSLENNRGAGLLVLLFSSSHLLLLVWASRAKP